MGGSETSSCAGLSELMSGQAKGASDHSTTATMPRIRPDPFMPFPFPAGYGDFPHIHENGRVHGPPGTAQPIDVRAEEVIQYPQLGVIDPLPHARRDDGRDRPGDQHQGIDQCPAPETGLEQQGDAEPKKQLEEDRDPGEVDRIGEGIPEPLVVPQASIIRETRELRDVQDQRAALQAQPQDVSDGEEGYRREDRSRRQEKHPRAFGYSSFPGPHAV